MRKLGRWILCGMLGALMQGLALGQEASSASTSRDVQIWMQALTRARAAVLGVRAVAVDDAPSNATLGRERLGSGVVIGDDGLVATIGYLIVEADHVELVLGPERVVPARVVAYDLASGFGLLQPLTPLHIAPVALGNSSALSMKEPLMIASGGEAGEISAAHLVSRRSFWGFWEYQVDDALFTAPARADHSGAALFNAKAELLGIGSLIVADALGPGQLDLTGNMFLPVDLLKRILPELRQRGATRSSTRAWLGVQCVEGSGIVRVVSTTPQSPAEEAGIMPGDLIVRIDDTPVASLDDLYQALWSGSPAERPVTLLILRGGNEQTIKVQAIDRMKTLRHAKGI